MTATARPTGAAEVTARELALALEAGAPIQLLDVRAPARVAAGKIELAPPGRFHNLVGSAVLALDDPAAAGLEPRIPVVVVCGLGNDSRKVAAHLGLLGYRAVSLRGGMAAWMSLLLPRSLPTPAGFDALVQFDRVGKGALGYLLVSDGEALVVDPPRDAVGYVSAAQRLGARLIGAVDTHVHADYLSGGPGLARALGLPYHVHPADMVYPYDGTPGRLDFRPIADGEDLPVGRGTVRVVHTPGHTEGSVTLLLEGVALTGDFLFVDSVGRPDLAGKTEEWTGALWRSLERARAEWDGDLVVYPAHYAADRERRPDRSVGARFGDLRTRNEGLRFADEAGFRAWVLGHAGSFPDAYRRIKAANIGLIEVDDALAQELETGRNQCALGGP